MKPEQMPTWLTRTLLLGLGAIFVLMPIHAFVSTWGGTTIGPLWLWKSWKEILLVALSVVTLGWLIANPGVLRSLRSKPLVIGLGLYLVLTALLAGIHARDNGTDATLAGLAMNLRYLGVAALAYLLLCYGRVSTIWLTRACWLTIIAGISVSVAGILQVLVIPSDFLTHFGYDKATTIAPSILIDNNPHLLRAFATLRGPNDFGAFLILPIILVVARLHRLPGWFSAGSLVLMTWALLLSGSRSAWIGVVVALGAYGLLRAGKNVSRQRLSIGLAVVLVAVAATLYAAVSVPQLRMAIFHSSPGDSSLTEGSTDNHLTATLGGIQRVVDNTFGCGAGCAGPASYYGSSPQISENYFVQIAEETGVLGLVLFLLVVGIVAYRLYTQPFDRKLSAVLLATLGGYVVIGLLLHVWSDDPLSMTWWMLAGAVIGYNERQQWIKSKNSSRSKT